MRHDSSNHAISGITRREFTGAIAGAGTLAVAGCLDVGGGDGDGSDATFTIHETAVPTDLQFNPYNFTNFPQTVVGVLYDQLAKYDPNEGTYIPQVVTDWSIDGETATLEISEEHTWHDGEDLTAEDIATQISLDIYMGESISSYVESASAVDDYTVELALNGSVNEEILYHDLFGKRANAPVSEYSDFLEDFENAADDDEIADVQAELLEFQLEEPVGSGPFAFDDVNEEELTLVRFEDHPAADDISFDSYAAINVDDVAPALEHGETDGTPFSFVPEEQVNDLPDHVLETRHDVYVGPALTFQLDHDHWGQRELRKAIAYIVDREAVAGNTDATMVASEYSSGIPVPVAEDWVGDAGMEMYEPDEESATALLEEAGWEKDGETWVDSNGDPVRPSISSPEWPDWVTTAQTIVSQLQSFGIEAELNSVDSSTYFGDTFPNGDFELAIDWWGGASSYPYFGFSWVFEGQNQEGPDAWNMPEEIDTPMPVGDPDGDLQAVNVPEKLTELTQTESGTDAETELIEELAWVINQTLPKLPIHEKQDQSFLNTERWDVPEDDPVMDIPYPPWWLPRVGEIEPRDAAEE